MSSRINPFFERKRFRKEQLFSKRTFLAQVLSLERKCVYGYVPSLSKEEIEGFGVKALDSLNVKMDCVIVAVAHDEFKNNPFLKTFLKSFINKRK
jgi:UDP-N-acetyl-D-mannosaminuronate dehydrogenase